jgi:hypothetical protein
MEAPAMSKAVSIGEAVARPFLLPGTLACSALGLGKHSLGKHSELVGMLINSLFWTVLGIFVVMVVV